MVRYLTITLLFINLFSIQAQKTNIVQMEVDEFEAPIGLDNPNPNFSWVIKSNKYNLNQTHYQILVATDKTFLKNSLVWDSGKVPSSESVYTSYSGKDLTYDKSYYWTVKV